MSGVTVLCGGVGAARFLRGLLGVVDPREVTAVVNVGDDVVLHGLDVSPDLDTVVYTLAGAIDPGRGWGLVEESWQALEQLRRYARANGVDEHAEVGNDAAGWFALGDRDLGTHLYRTSRRRAGVPLSTVTAEIVRTWGLDLRVLPVSDDPLRTVLRAADGRDLGFQEYFVRDRHDVPVREVRVEGAGRSRPAPGVLEAIGDADVVVIAPSNPVVSIDPVLAVPGVREAVEARRADAVAVSPIVGGEALKGPAARLLGELGHRVDVVGIARWYAPVATTLVIDHVDAALAADVGRAGMAACVTGTVMSDEAAAQALARRCLELGRSGAAR